MKKTVEKIKGFFLENLLIKVFSLLCAIFLWFFIIGVKNSELGLVVPLELKNIPPNFMVMGNVKNEIELRVTGPQTIVKNLNAQQVSVAIDLKNSSQGISYYNLKSESIKVPRGIKVVRVFPTTIPVRLEEVVKKDVEVQPDFKGSLPSGLYIGKVTVDPNIVQILGPKSDIQKISKLYTEPVQLKNINESISREYQLNLGDLVFSNISTKSVRVNIEVKKRGK